MPCLIAWYTVLAARISQAMLYRPARRVFRHTQRLSLEFHETYTSGRIIARQTSDLDAIRELLDSGISALVPRRAVHGVHRRSRWSLLDWCSGLVLLGRAACRSCFLTRWFQKRSQARSGAPGWSRPG